MRILGSEVQSVDRAEDAALHVEGLGVSFKNGPRWIRVVDDVSFSVARGQRVGLVGESGSGKSMTALSVMRLIPASGSKTDGNIWINSKCQNEMTAADLREIRGNEVSMIFQDPMTSLNPVYTVGHQLVEAIRLHRRVTKSEARQQAIESLRQVELTDPESRLDMYPHQLSGGICQRVMIAMALINRPKIVIADEPTTALDVTTQLQILSLLEALCVKNDTAVLLITHDLGVVSSFCDSVIVMYAGSVVEKGTTREVLQSPKHPYTIGLMAARPPFHGEIDALMPIPGEPPIPGEVGAGCAFAPRCAMRRSVCTEAKPPLVEVQEGHVSACYFAEDVSRNLHVGHSNLRQ